MLHKNIVVGDMHSIHQWEVADTTARTSLSLNPSDIGKVCYQLDTKSFYLLEEDSPPTWVGLGASGSSSLPSYSLPVLNATGFSISAGSIVTITGESAGVALVGLAKADSFSTSRDKTLGYMVDTTPDSASGVIQQGGLLGGLDTSSYTVGDTLYLSSTTAGAWTNSLPLFPFVGIKIGTVLKVDASVGIVNISIEPTARLQNLRDMNLTGLATGKVIAWDNTAKEWVLSTPIVYQASNSRLSEVSAISLAGNAGKVLGVNVGETALELITVSGGGGGGLSNITETLLTASPNNTVNTEKLAVTAGTTNVDIAITPRGTGGFALNASSSGVVNKRGAYSVDLQLNRSAPTQVSSGQHAGILCGVDNTASGTGAAVLAGYNNNAGGTFSIVAGDQNYTTAPYAIALGQANGATGNNSTAIGISNIASADYSFAFGYNASTDRMTGSYAYASTSMSGDGDAQYQLITVRGFSSSATPVILDLVSSSPSVSNSIALGYSSAYAFKALVVAKQASTGDSAAFELAGLVKIGASNGTVTLVGTPILTNIASDSGASTWTVSASVNTSIGALQIVVTGEASKSIKWEAVVQMAKIKG